MTNLADRAASVTIKGAAKRDNRRPAPDPGYATRFEDAVERSLNQSPNWRAGRPLEDHTRSCDCPSLTGCVERRPRGSRFNNSIIGRSKLDTAGRPPGQVNRPKTHCPKGHPYDQDNTYWQSGHRKCRTCLRTSQAATRAARR